MTQTTHQVADALGRKNMAHKLGVGLTAVSNAVVRGRFPSSWFLVLSSMAASAGVNLDPALCGMVINTPSVDYPPDIQEEAAQALPSEQDGGLHTAER